MKYNSIESFLLVPLYSVSVLQVIDPNGIANWSVTHVDWSEEKWHPKTYRAQDISYELLKNITVREKNLSLLLLLISLVLHATYFNDTVLTISVH